MAMFFASHEISIRRLRPFGQSIQNFSATFTAYQADIQPIGINRTNDIGGRIGSLYDMWVDGSVPIKEGDQVDDGSGKRYSVKAVSRFEGSGLLEHIQVILESRDG
jgi:hypothetical protein